LVYLIAIIRPMQRAGVWRVWEKDRVQDEAGEDKPLRLTSNNCRASFSALYFSILSAFFIGWRELNIGNWISRSAPQEYTLRGTGWVRPISGLQSLLSVYLLALSVLTYFGRPFE
jgi:hypothetical protein